MSSKKLYTRLVSSEMFNGIKPKKVLIEQEVIRSKTQQMKEKDWLTLKKLSVTFKDCH